MSSRWWGTKAIADGVYNHGKLLGCLHHLGPIAALVVDKLSGCMHRHFLGHAVTGPLFPLCSKR